MKEGYISTCMFQEKGLHCTVNFQIWRRFSNLTDGKIPWFGELEKRNMYGVLGDEL